MELNQDEYGAYIALDAENAEKTIYIALKKNAMG